MNKLLTTTLTALGLFILSPLFSQSNTYTVTQVNNVENITDYKTAMDKANFDSYRYINKRRKISFDTGVELELLSVTELQKLNIPVDASRGHVYKKKLEINPVFRLGKNGHILAEIDTEKRPNSKLEKANQI